MHDFYVVWPILIPLVAIVGAFTNGIVRSIANARVRELEVRERIAMIERGLVPPPEKDPSGFDRAMHRLERVREFERDRYYNRSPGRYRSAGVTLAGVGFGLMLLIGFTGGSPATAVGVGGFLVVMGLAFFVNSLFERGGYDPRMYPPPPPPSSQNPQPPSFGGPDQPR
jgi:hypothetical protein